jgi:Fe-S-cluster containining protein
MRTSNFKTQNSFKMVATWQCVKRCGACCHLDPDDRPDLEDYLTAPELELYLSMVGEDGWCINYDQDNRECTIYADRPRFCRVQADVFEDMYGIEPEELNDFAIACCQQQIEGVYGDRSPELMRFNRTIGA